MQISDKGLLKTDAYIDGQWEDFRHFAKRLNINRSDPKIKQIDLTGDGRPDLSPVRVQRQSACHLTRAGGSV